METQYSLFAMDWDYESPNAAESINEYQRKGIYTPCADVEILKHCGALPGVKRERAMALAKQLKKQYPFVQFAIYMGKTWGELQLIQTF